MGMGCWVGGVGVPGKAAEPSLPAEPAEPTPPVPLALPPHPGRHGLPVGYCEYPRTSPFPKPCCAAGGVLPPHPSGQPAQ